MVIHQERPGGVELVEVDPEPVLGFHVGPAAAVQLRTRLLVPAAGGWPEMPREFGEEKHIGPVVGAVTVGDGDHTLLDPVVQVGGGQRHATPVDGQQEHLDPPEVQSALHRRGRL
ncbi:hypothetical protein [Streptomyces sp. NPDC002851]